MSDIYYVSEGKLYAVKDGAGSLLHSGAVEKYKQNLKEIERRQEWKTSGAGARFMGSGISHFLGSQGSPENAFAQAEALTAVNPEKLVYAASLESSCGLYTKNPLKDDSAEGFVIRRAEARIFHIDYEPVTETFVSSVSDGPRECHIALIKEEHSDFDVITEGETVEITPSFSRRNPRAIYYSSAGYYVEPRKGKTHYSSYCINRLDLQSGELRELASDPKYDFIRPKETAEGKLYCIRRGKTAPKEGNFLLNILLIPFRFLKAVFGWMNFFTQRYTGESLLKGKKGGENPAKYQEKSGEEIFIEGNLINAEKTLKENTQRGEKYPGVAPKSWELGTIGEDGGFEAIKNGVLDYAFDGKDLIYSNGKYLIRLSPGGGETVVCPAKVAVSIAVI